MAGCGKMRASNRQLETLGWRAPSAPTEQEHSLSTARSMQRLRARNAQRISSGMQKEMSLGEIFGRAELTQRM
jgi:hypothetical protein